MARQDVYALIVPSIKTCFIRRNEFPMPVEVLNSGLPIVEIDVIEDCSTEYENGMDNAFVVRVGSKQTEFINVPVIVLRTVSAND